jgi:hypothetical protein
MAGFITGARPYTSESDRKLFELIFCKNCDLPLPSPDDHDQRRAHDQECSVFTARKEGIRETHKEYTCAVCRVKLVDGDKKIAVMKNCAHNFCLRCVESWFSDENNTYSHMPIFGIGRKNYFDRTCPMCRVLSPRFFCSTFPVVSAMERRSYFRMLPIVMRNLMRQSCIACRTEASFRE